MLFALIIALLISPMDTYPRNDGLDMLNYAFHLDLSDATDEIQGHAVIRALTLRDGANTLRLDLVERDGETGMVVERVQLEGETVEFRHEEDALWIPFEAEKGNELVFEVTYSGVPETGLQIGVEDHFTGFGAFDPEVFRHVLAAQNATNFWSNEVGDPVHSGCSMALHNRRVI